METRFCEDNLNKTIIPRKVKDENTIQLMDKMSKVIKVINSNGEEEAKFYDMKIPREKVEEAKEEEILMMLRELGINKVGKWKLLSDGHFQILPPRKRNSNDCLNQ